MSRVLVTGSNGLVGRHLVNYLLEHDHQVVAVDDLSNSDPVPEWTHDDFVTLVELDITSPESASTIAAMKPFSVVFHLAAHAYEGLSQFTPCMVSNTAIIGTLNVLRAAVNCGTVKRFVNVSSMARYGDGWGFDNVGPPFNEGYVPQPEDVYGHGKVMAERCVETLCDLHGLEWCHAVPHNITGEANLKALADPYRGAMLIWTNQLLRGQEITIFGDGEQKRAPSYAGDVVPALAKMGFIPEANKQVINLGGAHAYTINAMAESVRKAFRSVVGRTDQGLRYESERPCEVTNAWCTVSTSVQLLGYADETSLDDMADRIMRWAYRAAPSGVEPRYLDKFEIEAKAPKAWTEKRM